jgi:hypothetical protein
LFPIETWNFVSPRTDTHCLRPVEGGFHDRPVTHAAVDWATLVGGVQDGSFETGCSFGIFEACPDHQLGKTPATIEFRGGYPPDVQGFVDCQRKSAGNGFVVDIGDSSE